MITNSKGRSTSFFRFVSSGGIITTFAFLVCLLSAQNTQAQIVSGYTLTSTNGTFTPLAGATAPTIVNGDTDDGVYALVPIGFNFRYGGTTFTQASACTNGWMGFLSNNSFIFTNSLTSAATRPLVGPLFDDLDMTGGSVTYLTTGSSPNRVFTMQWLNARWNYLATTASISFQVKLYETTNRVQFIYRQEAGAVVAGDASFGASIGLAGAASGNFLSLNNSGTAPTASSTTETTTIGTRPATGQTYTFAPPVTAAGTIVGGRVVQQNGLGIRNAQVKMLDSMGVERTATTDSRGNYQFENVPSGLVYVFSVSHLRFQFDEPTQVQFIGQDVSGINFVGRSVSGFGDLWTVRNILPSKPE